MAALRSPSLSRRGEPFPFGVVELPVFTAAAKHRDADKVARLACAGVVAGASAERAATRCDANRSGARHWFQCPRARARAGALLVRPIRFVAKRIGNLQPARRTLEGDAGNRGEPAIRPECRRSGGAADIEAREQARGEEMADSLDSRQPRPDRVPTYRITERSSSTQLIILGTR